MFELTAICNGEWVDSIPCSPITRGSLEHVEKTIDFFQHPRASFFIRNLETGAVFDFQTRQFLNEQLEAV